MPPKLGIIAGRGELPARLAHACKDAGRDVVVIAFRGETETDFLPEFEHVFSDVAAVGRTIDSLKRAGAEELVLIGPIARPDFRTLRPDWRGARLLPRLLKAAGQGDDAIMKVVVDELEREGFRVIGAEEVMSDLAAPSGVLGRHRPGEQDRADIERGIDVVEALGRLDIGQAVVVREGYVLAVEAAEGTDAMLTRVATLNDKDRGRGGVLVKLPKPGQERRADLPTIGQRTVELCAAANLNGIAVEAAGALISEKDAVIRAADASGLFVLGFTPRTGD